LSKGSRSPGLPKEASAQRFSTIASRILDLTSLANSSGLPDCPFNFDFSGSYTDEQQREGGIEYNYRREAPLRTRGQEGAEISRSTPDGPEKFAAMCGTDAATYIRERPGMSAFAIEDGVVYHTYSTYARGLDGLWGMYQWLDRAPKGRNETGLWWRRHDEYKNQNETHACCGEK